MITNRRKPIFALGFLAVVILMVIISVVIPNSFQYKVDLNTIYQSPSIEHIFGTDHMGRDILTGITLGSKNSLLIGISASIIAMLIGTSYGFISGYFGKIVDNAMMQFLEILLCVPQILVLALIQGLFGGTSVISLTIAISITSWMTIARLTRTEVLRLKNEDFILASKILGASLPRIFWKHALPHIIPVISYVAMNSIASAILYEATLTFLGLGLNPELASWGTMLVNGEIGVLSLKYWTVLFPGIFIIMTVFSINDIGNYLKDNRISYLQ